MTTHEPKRESKAMRRARARLAERTKAYNALMSSKDGNLLPAQKAAHKPGSMKP